MEDVKDHVNSPSPIFLPNELQSTFPIFANWDDITINDQRRFDFLDWVEKSSFLLCPQ